MRPATHLAALLTAGALGLPGGVASAAVGAAATPAAPTRAAASPAEMPAVSTSRPKPLPHGNVISRADIDGDGRRDTTTFRFVSTDGAKARYRLSVRTARGATASLIVVTDDYFKQPASDFWVGVTGIDGVRGNEIVLDLVGGVGDAADIRSYGWRNGRLANIRAAGSSGKRVDWQVGLGRFRPGDRLHVLPGPRNPLCHQARCQRLGERSHLHRHEHALPLVGKRMAQDIDEAGQRAAQGRRHLYRVERTDLARRAHDLTRPGAESPNAGNRAAMLPKTPGCEDHSGL